MPQLDQITWFSQICWLVLIFLVMYVYILKDFAPALYKSKKIREKKLEAHQSSTIFYDYLNVEVLYNRWSLFKKIF
jgi:hypothetical protein